MVCSIFALSLYSETMNSCEYFSKSHAVLLILNHLLMYIYCLYEDLGRFALQTVLNVLLFLLYWGCNKPLKAIFTHSQR